MMFTSPRLLLFTLSVLMAAAHVRAEAVSYPEKKPAFSVDVPQDWKALFEKGALKLIPKAAEAVVVFQHVSDVKDEAAAKNGLPILAKQAAATFTIKNPEVAVQPMQTEADKFQTWMTAYKGKNTDNEDAFFYLAIFAPTQGDYYLVTAVYDLKDEKKTAEDRGKIQTSIRPAGEPAASKSKPDDESDAADDDDDGDEPTDDDVDAS